MLRAPAVILWLIAALVAAHLVRIALDPSDAVIAEYAFIPARYAHGFASVSLIIPFVSYMFLHANFAHLAINCVWLLALGPVVARRFGVLLFLAFFLICGIAGALALLALDWQSQAAAIGASGAISGLMGAAIRLMPIAGSPPPARPAPLLSRPVLVFTATWVVLNLVLGLSSLGADLTGGGAIAWQAHIGGYFTGLFLVPVFDRWRSA